MQKIYHFIHNCFSRLHLDYYRSIHSIKTAIACLIGLALVWYLKWPSGQWVPITIMVVMSAQPNFGGAVQKAYMRFLGTAAGMMIALVTLILLRDHALAVFTIIFLSCIFFTYIASAGGNISYAGTLGGVTVILTLTATQATPLLAIERGCYIVLGIIIALLVSRLVFPIHAREALRFSIASVLRRLRRMYFETISNATTESGLDHELNAAYRRIVKQTQLLEEAGAGSFYFSKYKKGLFAEVINRERKLYRLINLLGKSLSMQQTKVLQQLVGLEELHTAVEKCLENFAVYFESAKLQVLPNVTTVLQMVLTNAKKLPVENDLQILLQEHSCLFFLEQIVQELAAMDLIITKINQ